MSAHDAEATEVSDKRGDPAGFEPLAALDGLLSAVGLARMATGGAVSIAGEDPILPASHRLGACIGFPIMAAAVGSVVFRRHRGDPAQDLALGLRQAVHCISSGAFWHPTVNGEPPPFPLGRDNPFLLPPYQTREGRWIMASGVYPHLTTKTRTFRTDGSRIGHFHRSRQPQAWSGRA